MRAMGWSTLVALTALAATAAPAAAAPGDQVRCAIAGETTFDQPFGNEPREVTYRDKASGTCSGTLNGEAIADEPVVMRGEGSGTIGCLVGKTGGFEGRMTYTRGTESPADDVVVRFTAESTGALAQFVSVIRLEDGGVGVGHVDYFPRGESDLAERCAAGTVTRVPYTATAQTLTPIAP